MNQTYIKGIIQERINLIRRRTEKFELKFDPVLVSDLYYLADQLESLMEENEILREQVFVIEQVVPEEQRLENILASKCKRIVLDNTRNTIPNIKKEYLEITNSINNDIFVITIQKKFGKTPEQLREQSEIRRFKAVQKIVNVLKQNKKLRELSAELRKDVFSLSAIRMPDEASELKTQEEIQRAIDLLNKVIRSFNLIMFRRGLNKLQPSMRASFHEAWERAAHSDFKVSSLEKEVSSLKRKLIAAKHFTNSKFAKYRKKNTKLF